MTKERILFSDLTFGSKNVIMEDAQIVGSEIAEIALKRGIVLPTPDIKLFKTVFAMADEENLNGCTLPYEEVQKALGTLVGKAVDLEHYRKETVGTWLDAKLVGNVIIAYGTLWVNNYEEETQEILEDFANGRLTVSFEAWGVREDTGPFSYKLRDVHFCGGALLRHHTQPACPQAFVQEFSKKGTRVLEFAKVMSGEEIEESNFECECIDCGHTVSSESHCKDIKCEKCGGQMRRKDRPGPGQAKEEDNPNHAQEHEQDNKANEVSKEAKEAKDETQELIEKKIEETEIQNQDGGRKLMEEDLRKAQEELAELKAKKESLEEEKTAMLAESDEIKGKVESLSSEVTELTAKIEEISKEKEEIQAKLDVYVQAEEEERKVKMAEEAKSRRELLGVDESVSDEELLDEAKFEVMKLKKERDEAVAEIEKMKKSLEISGKKEDKEDDLPEWKKRQIRVAEKSARIR